MKQKLWFLCFRGIHNSLPSFWVKLGYSRIKIDLLSLHVLYSLQFKIGVQHSQLNFCNSLLQWPISKSSYVRTFHFTKLMLYISMNWFNQSIYFSKCNLLCLCAWNCPFKTIAQKVPTENFCIQFKETVCKFFACYSQLLARSATLFETI